jgi:DNA polymerase delta subunit 2
VAAAATGKADQRDALKQADGFFARLAALVSIEVLPGRDDPTNLSLPQLPLHPHLFPRVREQSGTFKSVSNPYSCELDGASFLGHSGQPVEDLLRCTDITEPLDALSLCLDGRHLAPTAPDTLPTQPFTEADPFIIDAPPRVLFSGGHARVGHRWRDGDARSADDGAGTMCICVPAFHRQRSIVFVNLRDPRDVRVETFEGEPNSEAPPQVA